MERETICFCPFCVAELKKVVTTRNDLISITCNTCGKYSFSQEYYEDYIEPKSSRVDKNKIAWYLYYNKQEKAVTHICQNESLILDNQHNVSMTGIESWNPKSFSEKVDMFLLGINSAMKYLGEEIKLTDEDLRSACFVIRGYDLTERPIFNPEEQQVSFFLEYLQQKKYIRFEEQKKTITLLPSGLSRVDELIKNTNTLSKNVFIAMSFAKEMTEIRETIKRAIEECNYVPRIMDEVEHNHQIVPEMLHEIRQSKFVIVELTNHNNGAYFEAGYALGIGKEVIQVCKRESFNEKGHFDVKQINTVEWDTTDDLLIKLRNRILATMN